MADLRVGVVGLGVGRAHLRSWSTVEGASVVAVADVDEERRRAVEQEWGVAVVDSLDALLAARVDVVDLCTPPSMHEAQIERCQQVGVCVGHVGAPCHWLRHLPSRRILSRATRRQWLAPCRQGVRNKDKQGESR